MGRTPGNAERFLTGVSASTVIKSFSSPLHLASCLSLSCISLTRSLGHGLCLVCKERTRQDNTCTHTSEQNKNRPKNEKPMESILCRSTTPEYGACPEVWPIYPLEKTYHFLCQRVSIAMVSSLVGGILYLLSHLHAGISSDLNLRMLTVSVSSLF